MKIDVGSYRGCLLFIVNCGSAFSEMLRYSLGLVATDLKVFWIVDLALLAPFMK